MATVWIAHREGLRLRGAPISTVPLSTAVTKLDLAPWRLFAASPPEKVSLREVEAAVGRKRVLVEVDDGDRYDLCGLPRGWYDSPYSPAEARRRLGLSSAA